MEIWILIVALFVVLGGAECFTNALEHLGERLGISEGVTGSVFAAVGTALPEAMVPVIAVLASSGSLQTREEVGVEQAEPDSEPEVSGEPPEEDGAS